jgi:lysophospholipase L1-like esterase
MIRYALPPLLAFAALMPLMARAAEPAPFALKDGDTVVFYGDSITEQNYYTQWVELYTATRFPRMHVRFVTSGVGGDTVAGGWGGTIDERLARDVFPYKPSVVTIMLGMNDGHYGGPDDKVTAAYIQGYGHLLDALHDRAPQARLTLIGPSAFDDVTRPVGFPGGYNQVMQHFSALDRDMATARGATYVDLNAPVVDALRRAYAADPMVARGLIPDRVHPEPIIHWVMAAALLKGWNAPAIVSAVTIDAAKMRVVSASNATVDNPKTKGRGLEWSALENALPLPFDRGNETFSRLMAISDIQQALNDEHLTVAGLKPGQYALAIDGKAVGTFSDTDLAAGINLADYHTPMRDQAQSAQWTIRDRVQAHFVRMRLQVNKVDLGSPDVIEALDRKLEDDLHRSVQPVSHHFTLMPMP